MKFLFIIQGEGRGHFTQALVMKEMIGRHGDEVVACLVGKSPSRQLPDYFLTKMNVPLLPFDSPNFLPTAQNKRPDLLKSTLSNLIHFPGFVSNMMFIRKKIKEYKPDIVINFYELLAGLTYLLFSPSVPMVCIGHQYMFLHHKFRFPQKSAIALFSLRFFTRLTSFGSVRKLALSFYPMADDIRRSISVVPPLLRSDVLNRQPVAGEYIHGYVLNSGYIEDIKKWQQKHPDEKLEFFWDKKDAEETVNITPNLTLHRINDKKFLYYMAGCKAYSTTAGFESVCEAVYMQKPVLMVPAHIEQECNAWDAMKIGAGVISNDFDLDKLLAIIPEYTPNTAFRRWVSHAESLIYAEFREVYENSNCTCEAKTSYPL